MNIPVWGKNHSQIDLLKQIMPIISEEGQKDTTTLTIKLRVDSIIKAGNTTEEFFTKTVNSIGSIFRRNGNLAGAVEFYLKAVSYYEQKEHLSKEETESLLRLYIPLGASNEELGLWSSAMDYYLKALTLAEKHHSEDCIAMIYNNIGAIYYTKNELKKAETYFLKALDINKKSKNKQELFNNYNNLGGVYLQMNMENRALDYALQALQLLDSNENPELYYFMQSNIGNIYLKKKENALAKSFLHNAMVHQKQYKIYLDLIQTYNSLSALFEQTEKKDSALIYLKRALEISQSIGHKQMESQIQQRLAKFYRETGNISQAYEALNTSVILNDSILAADNNKKIGDMERIYNVEKKMYDNELKLKDITLQEVATNRLWLITICIASGLVIVILILIGYTHTRERQRKTEVNLTKQQTALLEEEKLLQKQKEQELNDTLDQRNRELTSYTLNMLKMNDFIANVHEELKQLLLELNPRDRQRRMEIQKIQTLLQQQNVTNNWEEFRFYFEQVHPSFYKNLEQLHPDLTVKEKRLCAFLRLGLSSKDIAAITFKELRSVDSARNRLRKKLNIAPDDNLIEILSKI